MAFTKQQQLAIDSKNKDILVSAAAGSGKTTILVERIIKMLLDKNDPTTIDSMLVVTFSRAAAAEMRKRIFSAFSEEVNKDPKNKYLRNQLSMINQAEITTLDSFFLSVVKKYFKAADVDPNFRIGDSAELELLSSQVLDDYFQELYEKNDEQFLYLCDVYSSKPTDDALEQIVLNISKKIENVIYPEKWFKNAYEQFNFSSETDYFKSDIFNNIKSEGLKIISESEKYIDEIKKVHDIFNAKLPKFLIDDIETASKIKALIENDNNLELFNYMKLISAPRFFSPCRIAKSIEDEKVSQYIKCCRNNYKDMILEYAVYFEKTPRQYLEEYSYLYKITKKLAELTLTYNQRFFKLKKEKALFSFSDITQLCLKVLMDENGNPTQAAKDYRKKFNEIIVDEFQDSNFIQDCILTAISGKSDGHPNMFMVGDLKQCIYKFRGSEPSMFNDKYNRFKNNVCGDEEKIDLNKNFRSRQCVVDCINFIFKQIMSEDIGEAAYDEAAMLYAGADYPQPDDKNINYSTNCEFHIINSAKDNNISQINETDEIINEYRSAELEASFIAKRINELIFKEKISVYDNKLKAYRPAVYKDFVILMRGTKKTAPIFTEILSENSIPSFCSNGAGFFNVIEVKTILSLLSVIDNPYQDIDLIALLHSPIYSFSADELLEIRLCEKNCYFYNAIKSYVENNSDNTHLKQRLIDFLSDLKRWSYSAVSKPISEMLYILYNETNYYNYVGMLSNGSIRQANLDNLCEKAKSFEDMGFNGLFKFTAFISSIKTISGDMEASAASESENLVRIMTIHKSKGLEFPFVFLTSLGSKFNLRQTSDNFLLHTNLGLASKINKMLSPENFKNNEEILLKKTMPKISYKSQYFNYTADIIKKEQFSEEMRLLYVALTRAKEKFIMVGVCDIESKAFKNKFTGIIPSEPALYPKNLSNNYMDWILKALSRHPDNVEPIVSYENPYGLNNIFKAEQSKFYIKISNRSELEIKKRELNLSLDKCFENLEKLDFKIDYSGFKKEVFSSLSFNYPYESDLKLPSTASISEIKRNYQPEIIEEDTTQYLNNNYASDFPLPDFYGEKKEDSFSILRGTAFHTVMEHIDFNIKTYKEIKLFIENLKENNILSCEQFKSININKILNFLNSELCQRIRNSKWIFREEPFVMGMKPNEIYPDEQYSDSDCTILLHGIIDLYFIEDDYIVLLDYKTDKITSVGKIKEKYNLQLQLYKRALEKSLGKKVKETFLYLFDIDKYVNI